MTIIKRLQTIWVSIVFLIPFILIFPLFWIFIQNEKWKKYAYGLTYLWSRVFFVLSGIRFEIQGEEDVPKDGLHIFCPNHSSYLDIATMVRSGFRFAFVGKNSMEKLPFFGYMYKNLHVTVDRKNLKSRYNTIIKSREVLEKGMSLTLFPEGGIKGKAPKLTRFKDGAFRLAIEKQIPIVPVTIPFNWIILADNKKFFVETSSHRSKVIFHAPIYTKGMTKKDIDSLKNRTYKVIEAELENQNR